MAMTLVEAAKYSNDILQVGVIEKLVYNDPILERLQFKDIVGNGLTYNVETALSGASFYGVGDTWTESTSTVTQTTAVTTILGGDADVDNFLKATRSNVQDLMSEQITAKTKAMKIKFGEMFIYGYYNAGAGYDAKGFDGLHALIKSQAATATIYENTICMATSTGTGKLLQMSKLEEAVDLVKNGPADMILMSKGMRRAINKYVLAAGGITYEDRANGRIQTLFGIPVAVSDHIVDTEDATKNYGGPATNFGFDYTVGTAKSTTSDLSTTIFVLHFAPDGVCGIQSMPVTVENLGALETKDAVRVRIKWYPGLMLQSIIAASKVSGILVAGAVAA